MKNDRNTSLTYCVVRTSTAGWLASNQLADPYRLRGSFPKACPWIGVQAELAFFNISLTFRKDAMERQAESGALDPHYNLLKEFHYHRVQRP